MCYSNKICIHFLQLDSVQYEFVCCICTYRTTTKKCFQLIFIDICRFYDRNKLNNASIMHWHRLSLLLLCVDYAKWNILHLLIIIIMNIEQIQKRKLFRKVIWFEWNENCVSFHLINKLISFNLKKRRKKLHLKFAYNLYSTVYTY